MVATADAQDEDEAEPEAESTEDQLARLRQERDSYLDGLQRSRADLDNYRKRATQERLQAASRGKADLLHALLPILSATCAWPCSTPTRTPTPFARASR